MKILVIDVGGTNVKVASTDCLEPIKIPSGPTMTAAMMCHKVLQVTKDWKYDRVSVGFPGPVIKHRPIAEPHNLGPGWVDFDYEKAFQKPLRFINDAAMQALGGYKGGQMLFLGLGTGMGSAMVINGTVVPLELAHLPYKKGRSYEDYVGDAALSQHGKKRWREHVNEVIGLLQAAMVCETVLLGGGNAKLMKNLPSHVIVGSNSNAITGGFRLWDGEVLTPVKKAVKKAARKKPAKKA